MKISRYISITILVILSVTIIATGFQSVQIEARPQMILIPGGKFTAGISKLELDNLKKRNRSRSKKLDSFFKISYSTECKSFYIDKFEVTNGQFLSFMKKFRYKVKSKHFDEKFARGNPDLPVNYIGWADASAYAKSVNKRLPTEEEWERAARGTKDNLWPWGNSDDGELYNGYNQGYLHPVEVGSFPGGKSEFGVVDMSGNVYEMTTGRWYNEPCMKGGSYLNQGFYTMCAFRWAADDTINGARWLGFRCVQDTEPTLKKKK
jgi:formylglycine-generating enzyme required for sulfatase activity